MLGASGFLGGRLVERLVTERGASVRMLVRRVATGAAAVRYPVEFHVGDLLDTGAVARAMTGCDVVYNCVKGTGGDAARRRAVDVDAAGQVVEAASRTGARVIHVSTFAVYDLPADGDIDERMPDAPRGDPYVDGKRAGERLALDTGRRLGVPVTVIQPTVVYGPRAGVHAADILEEMRTGKVVLVNGGIGICNAVFVDDVVTALLLAAGAERGAGERILVSGPEHPTWAEFFGAFERMLGEESTVSMTEAEALAFWQRSKRRPWLLPEALKLLRDDAALRKRLLSTREAVALREAAQRVVPGLLRSAEQRVTSGRPPVGPARRPGPARPWLVRYLAKRGRVRIDKARELLGYEPVFGLGPGMRLTEQWARWAGLIG